MFLQSWSIGAVEVISSFCLSIGLLKFRIARNSNIMKILLLVLSPFYYAHKYRTLARYVYCKSKENTSITAE